MVSVKSDPKGKGKPGNVPGKTGRTRVQEAVLWWFWPESSGLKHLETRFGESGRWLFRWNILLQLCST